MGSTCHSVLTSEGNRIFIGSEVPCTRVRITGQREVGSGYCGGFLMDLGGSVGLRQRRRKPVVPEEVYARAGRSVSM